MMQSSVVLREFSNTMSIFICFEPRLRIFIFKENFMSKKIISICAIQVLDSRGNPTVEVEVVLDGGARAIASVPSGASTGEFEAAELRDGDSSQYFGKGVLSAVRNVNTQIAESLIGKDVSQQRHLDVALCELDGSKNKGRLGANAILGVSLAIAKARAAANGVELYRELGSCAEDFSMPVPLVNVLNGGAHANNSLDIQEFMIVPLGACSFSEALRWSAETFHSLGRLLEDDGYSTAVGDEGGYAPRLESTELAFDFLLRSIEHAGYKPGQDISIALDVAASELCENCENSPVYVFRKSGGEKYSSNGLVSFYQNLVGRYPIVSIEDGLDENDWEGWQELTAKLGGNIQLVGDDLFVTNTDRIQRGIDSNVGNSVLVKLNQIGTLSETIDAISLASSVGYTSVISHRSGETCDSTIADLSVALGCGQIKTGSTSRGERMAKYNRLLRIEAQLADKARYTNPFSR